MPPAPVYKGARGRPAGPLWRAPKRGILLGLQVLVGFHQKGEGGKEGEGEGEGKGAPPFLVQFGLKGEGARGLPWPPLSLSTKAHLGPLVPPGVPITLRHSGFIRNFSGTLLVSEYRRPIYQSLCLDHFETPRHVRDHIRDSEQSSVHKNT